MDGPLGGGLLRNPNDPSRSGIISGVIDNILTGSTVDHFRRRYRPRCRRGETERRLAERSSRFEKLADAAIMG
jgi:hypothetical protein